MSRRNKCNIFEANDMNFENNKKKIEFKSTFNKY